MAILDIGINHFETTGSSALTENAMFETISGLPFFEGATTTGGYMQSTLSADTQNDVMRWIFGASRSDFWFHCRALMVQDATADRPFIVFGGPTTDLFRLSCLNASEHWMAEYWDGGAWQQVGSDITSPTFTSGKQIDVHITMSNTVGVFEVFVDRVSMMSLGGGDTIFTADTAIDFMKFSGVGSSFLTPTYFSDLLTADEITTEFVLKETSTSTVGDHTEWNGPESDIDDQIFDPVEATFITSNVTAEKNTYNMAPQDAIFDTDHDVIAVYHHVRARGAGVSTLDIKPLLRKSSTDYLGGTITLSSRNVDYITEYLTDPSTASAWASAAAVEAMQFGFQSV